MMLASKPIAHLVEVSCAACFVAAVELANFAIEIIANLLVNRLHFGRAHLVVFVEINNPTLFHKPFDYLRIIEAVAENRLVFATIHVEEAIFSKQIIEESGRHHTHVVHDERNVIFLQIYHIIYFDLRKKSPLSKELKMLQILYNNLPTLAITAVSCP